jgi:hypothetical protein
MKGKKATTVMVSRWNWLGLEEWLPADFFSSLFSQILQKRAKMRGSSFEDKGFKTFSKLEEPWLYLKITSFEKYPKHYKIVLGLLKIRKDRESNKNNFI